MNELNWSIFDAKFNGKEQSSFERLAYHLFCYEHGIEYGIFRFKNQTGIETEPILRENEWIGFQSKYYDTKISEKKDDIIDSIKKAREKNPNLSKIIFYLNKEFSESTKKDTKDPQYKSKIEEFAKSLGVVIEWRVPSHFEIQLASPQNQYISDYFFSLNETIVDFVNNLEKHTENLFSLTHDTINFNDQKIKIERRIEIANLEHKLNQLKAIIISGNGGSGKTALVKEFYQNNKSNIPLYLFKATEFEILNINSLFEKYGGFSLYDFIEAHKQEKNKIIIIDSAEKLSDLENQEPLKELITALNNESWKIIFTTRSTYLEDLCLQIIEYYKISFGIIKIKNLKENELQALTKKYSFNLPKNKRISELIRNLFYLDKYLYYYDEKSSSLNYTQFKKNLWSQKIQNSSYKKNEIHISREKCFLEIIKSKCNKNLFYVHPDNCNGEILHLLGMDEIISYDSNNDGYFITQDIYEEWGLDFIIERAYNNNAEYNNFFREIGTSLLIRRAFRNWLSDKIIENIDDLKKFIEKILIDENIELFWRDEVLISVLLSDYSSDFFHSFEKFILKDNYSFLKKIIFLLRISCKEIDDDFKKLAINLEKKNLKYVFTKPKGSGWINVVNLIYRNQNSFTIDNIGFILPLFQDWVNKNKKGETTKKIGKLCLKFYKEIQIIDEYRYKSQFKEELQKIIINSIVEIKDDINIIIDEVIDNKWIEPTNPYYNLSSLLLEFDIENIQAIATIPESIIKLADLFWFKPDKNDSIYYEEYRLGTENYYSLNKFVDFKYTPASAYQTPILWLLNSSFEKTIDFILNFTNKCVGSYVKSDFDERIEEINIVIDSEITQKQYISESLWNMYRGAGSPVAPDLLQSIHMALEKYLLENAKTINPKILQNWLIYMIKNSFSASITSIVASVVLAYPEKLFNVSSILFSSIDLFFYDNIRLSLEDDVKYIYSMKSGFKLKNTIFENERLSTLNKSHRKLSLENLALKYQVFKSEDVSEEEFTRRQKILWNILDDHYTDLSKKSQETEFDKNKRLLLARIDRRKMSPSVEQEGDDILIKFNPEIDQNLEKYSEESINKANERIKYLPLFSWSLFKLGKSEKPANIEKYENDPKLVLAETKKLIESFENKDKSQQYIFLNSHIPAFSCSALLKDYSNKLSPEEKNFCAEIIVLYASNPLQENYQYQISDGVEVSINAIPYLYNIIPEKSDELNTLLLLLLFDNFQIGHYKRLCDYSIESILNDLWRISPDNAIEIIFGFLNFKPLFNSLKLENDQTRRFQGYVSHNQVLINFISRYEDNLLKFWNDPEQITELEIENYSLNDLDTIFQLIPDDTEDKILLEYISKIVPFIFINIFETENGLNHSNKLDYLFNYRFFKKYSLFILSRKSEEISSFIIPVIDNISNSKETVSFIQSIIFVEDQINHSKQFWTVWECLYDRIVEMVKQNNGRYLDEIIQNYLLAGDIWKPHVKGWHSLKDSNILFYKTVVNDIGYHPYVLDSIAKLLNEVGSIFLEEGVFWISEIIKKNVRAEKIEENTIFYIETVLREYIYLHRKIIKQNIHKKSKIFVILEFLINHGSVTAYLLREDLM